MTSACGWAPTQLGGRVRKGGLPAPAPEVCSSVALGGWHCTWAQRDSQAAKVGAGCERSPPPNRA